MTLLEVEDIGEGSPQGVVLLLVGPDQGSPKEAESLRTLRMYNLASLTSLAKWAIAQKVRTVLSNAKFSSKSVHCIHRDLVPLNSTNP